MDNLFAMALGKASWPNSSRIHGSSFGRRHTERQTLELLSGHALAAHQRASRRFVGREGKEGRAAIENARQAILIEINEAYLPVIARSCDVTPGLALTSVQETVEVL